jgi:hypothetical protein
MYQCLESKNSVEHCIYKAGVLVGLTEAEQEWREASINSDLIDYGGLRMDYGEFKWIMAN